MEDTRANPPRIFDAGLCSDLHPHCEHWALEGYCDLNAEFMVGSDSYVWGNCRASCKRCTVCAPEDQSCYRANRDRNGYLNLSDEILHLTGRPLGQATW